MTLLTDETILDVMSQQEEVEALSKTVLRNLQPVRWSRLEPEAQALYLETIERLLNSALLSGGIKDRILAEMGAALWASPSFVAARMQELLSEWASADILVA